LLIKFRTLNVTEDGAHVAQVLPDDARVTRVGRWLRRLWIDELPQLINVLKGDMAIVGPRPHAVAHDAHFRAVDTRYGRRFAARPGLTGLAQVMGARGCVVDDDALRRRTDFDLQYIRNWSLWLDIWIVVRTALLWWQPNRDPMLDFLLRAGSRVDARAPSAVPTQLTIAHIITRYIRGGADENTRLSCNAQAAAGHRVTLIFGRETHDEMLAALDARVERVRIDSLVRRIDPICDAIALMSLVRTLRNLKPDVVHTHTSKAGILGRLAGRIVRAKAIVHGVHILPFLNVQRLKRWSFVTIERLTAPLTDAFVSVSPKMQECCLAENLGAHALHKVVPSGRDVALFRDAAPFGPAELTRELGQETSPSQLIVMAAALEPRKRVADFLPVFREVAAECPGAMLVVLGEGPERELIETQAAELSLSERVRLLGFRNDVERWMASAAVCVLSSEREGLPRAVVQYVLAGRPVVAADLPGLDAVVHDGENGFVTNGDDLMEMAAPIVRLLTTPTLCERFSAYSRRLDLSPWSVENMTGELERVYFNALHRKQKLQPPALGEPAWIS
jgi:glycosyltransferase involved in cell wall biosynthesis